MKTPRRHPGLILDSEVIRWGALFLSVSALVAVLLISARTSASVSAPEESRGAGQIFTNADLRGSYGIAFEGTLLGAGPLAVAGVLTADGKGGLTDGARTLNVNGTAIAQTLTCDYAVKANGAGSARCAVITVGQPGTAIETFDFVLSDRGREVRFIATTPGVVAMGSAARQ